MHSTLIAQIPSGCWTLLTFLIAAAVIWYALYKKGDVRAEFTHGKSAFRIIAMDRRKGSK